MTSPIDKDFKLVKVADYNNQVNSIRSNLNMGLLTSLKDKMSAISSKDKDDRGPNIATLTLEKMQRSLAVKDADGTARF